MGLVGLKVIGENLITSLNASSEQANFPVENLFDNHIKKQWKAETTASVVTLDVLIEEPIDTLALFNTVADNVALSINYPNNTAWEEGTSWEVGTQWEEVILEDYSIIFGSEDFSEYKNLWIEFETAQSYAEITLTFTVTDPTNNPIRAGALRGGIAVSTTYPVYRPLGEGSEDYSIKKELSNGDQYYKKRDIVRTFSCSVLVGQCEEFYSIMNIARSQGQIPLAWKLVNTEDYRFVMFARFNNGMPSGSHEYADRSTINFNLIEAL